MRFFVTFPEALNELKRELKEMGILIHQKSVQNMDVSNNPDYEAYELQNYMYTVTSPEPDSIPLANPTWCQEELLERTSGRAMNPGNAWKRRADYWKQFFSKTEPDKFDYAYPDRLSVGIPRIIQALKQDLNTRRAFLPVFDRIQDNQDSFDRRIPCSLGYWFFYRQSQLNVTYLQRSADFSEHFNNDIWLAYMLNKYIAFRLNVKPGVFSHWLGSLHIFSKDVKGVF